MLHCVVGFSCFFTFYASPTSLVASEEKFGSFLFLHFFLECKLRDTLPQPQNINAGIWPSCFYFGAEPKWQLEPRLCTNSEMSTRSNLAVIIMATHWLNHCGCPSIRRAG